MQYELMTAVVQDTLSSGLVSVAATVITTAAIVAGTCVTLIILVVKMSARWTTIEVKQDALIQRVDRLVADKDNVHRAIVSTISSLNDRLWELHTSIQQKRGS